MKLLLNSTPISLWHEIIHEAQGVCDIVLKEELEAYLVFLMMRYTSRPEIAKKIIAHEFLTGLKAAFAKRQAALRDVGDQCLLLAGLFPHVADKKQVKIRYFVDLGQSAYAMISDAANDVYASLAAEFVALMDILQSIRQYSKDHADLLPLEAYELWSETGSQRALSVLKRYTQSSPILVDIKNK